MAGEVSTNCFVCGEGDDPRDGTREVMVKAWAHPRHRLEGVDVDGLYAGLPCCDAAHILSSFGGMLIQQYKATPDNELWEADNAKKRIVRYRIAQGKLVRLASGDRMPSKVEGGEMVDERAAEVAVTE